MKKLRDYTPDDKVACVALFDSNSPKFFGPQERAYFVAFLDEMQHPYFIVESHNAEPIACGGFSISPPGDVAKLRWDMVSPVHQGRGIGHFLVVARLALLSEDPRISVVRVNTSQLANGFYEKERFVTRHVTENGIAPGLHEYEMELSLSPEARQSIVGEWARLRVFP